MLISPKIVRSLLLFTLLIFSHVALANLSNCAKAVWGTAPPNSLYLGMWTFHLKPGATHNDNYNDWLIGGLYKSVFFATFLNSFGDRSYAVGIQRMVYTHPFHQNWNYAVGYRLAGIYGYDSRFMKLAGETPILPVAQIVSDLSYRHVGWEVTYTGIIVSTSFFIKF